jgi:hypothetical protein
MLWPLGDGDGLVRWAGSAPAPAKLLIIDLITKHDVETYEQLAGEGDFCLGPPASLQDGEIAAPKLVVRARSQRGLSLLKTRRLQLSCVVRTHPVFGRSWSDGWEFCLGR